jgi:predicted Zn finger-like uncharacterized protein
MIITCSKCGRQLSVNDASVTPGAKVKCPSCETIIDVGAASPANSSSPIGLAPEADIPPTPKMPTPPPPVGRRMNAESFFSISANHLAIAKMLIVAGLMMVVLARGFTSMAMKNVSRRTGVYQKASEKYVEDEGRSADPFNNTSRGEQLQKKAKDASYAVKIMPYWHEWLFIIGTLALVYGLLITGFGPAGPEKIVALVMLAILTFSIYVAGMPWISSFASMF